MREWENQMKVPKTILFTSQDMVNNRVFRREVKIGGRTITIEGLSRIGTAYVGIKKANEDGCIAIMDNTSLQLIVVDGGTQVEKVATLDAQRITGGKYIAMKVEEFGQWLNPSAHPAENLRALNVAIGNDIAKHHPDITYTKYSRNIPYGSIAAIKIDVGNNTLEVANAGDVFAIIVDSNRIASLLTIDDVHEKDQQTFAVAKRLAKQYGVTFRYAMQERTNDRRFHEIVEEMYETLRQGNTGEIRRITGAPNFDVTASVSQQLGDIKAILLFSDGALPPGLDVTTSEGLQDLTHIVDAQGLDGLNAEILKRIADDQDFEKFPRFGHLDDLTIVNIFL